MAKDKEEASSSSSSSSSSQNDSSGGESSEEESREAEEYVDPMRLKTPVFSLPNNDDYELWTIRLPGDVDISALDGVELTMGARDMGEIRCGDDTYGFTMSDSGENGLSRILINNGKKGMMNPSKKTFAKHISVVHENSLKEILGTDLAPGIDRAPKPVDYVRHAYSAVPQKKGLKRRWMPMGSPPVATKSSSSPDVDSGSNIDQGERLKVKIESPSAKKKAKKGKKKAKKIKKRK